MVPSNRQLKKRTCVVYFSNKASNSSGKPYREFIIWDKSSSPFLNCQDYVPEKREEIRQGCIGKSLGIVFRGMILARFARTIKEISKICGVSAFNSAVVRAG